MLTTIRVVRVLVGIIAAWQILGLMPMLTWFPTLGRVTGQMWAIALIKLLVMLVCGAIYLWLGKVRSRIAVSGNGGSDGTTIVLSILALIGIGTIITIVISAFSDRDQVSENYPLRSIQFAVGAPGSTAPQYARPPTIHSKGWTQESTGSEVSGPWLADDPPGTRYYKFTNGTIYRFFPPGVRPDAEEANPFALGYTTDRPPSN